MSKLKLLRAVMGGVWLMDRNAGEAYLPAVLQLLSGQPVTFFDDDEKEKEPATSLAIPPGDPSARIKTVYDKNHQLPEGSIAIIRVEGPMMKEDFCGTPGTATLANWVKNADNHASIIGTVMIFDTPGGHVDGNQYFANTVAATQKPIVALVDGMMASAGYWIGSSTNHIMASCDTDMIGSIGTRITLADYKEQYAKWGVKIHEITADASKDKMKMIQDAFDGNYATIKTEMLNPTNEIFLTAVKANRGEALQMQGDEPLTGKIYLTEKAMSLGLIDSKGRLEDALDKVQELSSQSTAHFKSHNNKMSLFGQKFKALSALGAKQRSGEAVTQSEIDSVNAELQSEGITGYAIVTSEELQTAIDARNTSEAILADVARTLAPEATDEEVTESVADLPEAVGQLVTALAAAEENVQKLGSKVPPVQRPVSKTKGSEIKTSTTSTEDFYSETDAELDAMLNEINGGK